MLLTSKCPLGSTKCEIFLANNHLTRLFRGVEGIHYADEAWVQAQAKNVLFADAIFAKATDACWEINTVPVTHPDCPEDDAFLGWILFNSSSDFDCEVWKAQVSAWLKGFFCFGDEGCVAAASSTYRETVWHEWLGEWPKSLAECVLQLVEEQIKSLSHWDLSAFAEDSDAEDAWEFVKSRCWAWEDWENFIRDMKDAERLVSAMTGLVIRPSAYYSDIETLALLEERIGVLKKLYRAQCCLVDVVGKEPERFLP